MHLSVYYLSSDILSVMDNIHDMDKINEYVCKVIKMEMSMKKRSMYSIRLLNHSMIKSRVCYFISESVVICDIVIV